MAWWELEIIGKENLDDVDLDHIADLIKKGYTEGELNEEEYDLD